MICHCFPSAPPIYMRKEPQRGKISPFLSNPTFSIEFFPFFLPNAVFFSGGPPSPGTPLYQALLSSAHRSHPPTATKDRTHRATFVNKNKEVRGSITRQTVPDCRGRTTEGEEMGGGKSRGRGGERKTRKTFNGINSAIIMRTVNCR